MTKKQSEFHYMVGMIVLHALYVHTIDNPFEKTYLCNFNDITGTLEGKKCIILREIDQK